MRTELMVEDVYVMKKEKALPESHRYAICSFEGMPIKEFYNGIFEEIFIFNYPFIKSKTIKYDLINQVTYPARS